MGSWYKTCGLTGLPILHGEPVIVFPIIENEFEKNYVYSSSYFSPFLCAFDAEYNDYGGAINEVGLGVEVFLSYLQRYMVELELGENEHYDLAAKKEGLTFEHIWQLDWARRLFTYSKKQKELETSFVMLRKDCVDHLLNEYVYTRDYSSTKLKFNNLVEELATLVDTTDLSKLSYVENLFIGAKHDSHLMDFLYPIFIGTDSMYNNSYLREYCRLLLKKENLTKEELYSYFYSLIRSTWVDLFMRCTRKAWIRAIGEGSQGVEAGAYQELIKVTKTGLKDIKKYHEEY